VRSFFHLYRVPQIIEFGSSGKVFELCDKILNLDVNVRVCFMSVGEINQESLREWHLTKSICCTIKNLITIR
jgi:hypothetical protein